MPPDGPEDTTDDAGPDEAAADAGATTAEKALTEDEREAVVERRNLSALTVYSIVLREGEEELQRPKTSLWWSGVAAGIGISTSILAEGILRSGLDPDLPYRSLLVSLGYTFGFVLVIMSRLQLFTENTITAVLPLLATPTPARLGSIARLWGIVFAANMTGTFLAAILAVHGGILPEAVLAAVLEVSREATGVTPATAFLHAIPAGFVIAALVWMLPSARGSEVAVVVMFTWLIAAGGFTHVVAGSNEIFNLVAMGEIGILPAFGLHVLPVLGGNVLGGSGLFALLAYGQVHKEITDE